MTEELEVVDLATADVDAAHAAIGSSFPGLGFAPTDGTGFTLAVRRVADGFFAVNRISLAGRAEIRGEFPDLVAGGRVQRGRYALECGGSSLDTAGPFLWPPGRQTGRLEDTLVEVLAMEPRLFLRQAVQHLAGTGEVLHPATAADAVPISPEAALTWHLTVNHITQIAEDLEVFALPLVRFTLIDLYVTTLLTTFPLTRARGTASSSDARPAAVRRAMRYVDDHLADPITTSMIAEAARLSVRGLHHNFAVHLATTPLQYVRELRLRAAREDLLAADPVAGDSVAVIARRWGFAHLSRFAQRYRQAFDELPSETLRR